MTVTHYDFEIVTAEGKDVLLDGPFDDATSRSSVSDTVERSRAQVEAVAERLRSKRRGLD